MRKIIDAFILSLSLFLASCASTTDGGAVGADRRQFMVASSADVAAASAESYAQLKKEAAAKGTLNNDKAQVDRLRAIAKKLIPLTAVFRKDATGWEWETNLITSPELNAFCMPGGKIIFYSGIIEKLQLTDGEIAAIMGHEIAHALREHGRERMSEELIKNGVLLLLVQTGKLQEQHAALLSGLSTVFVSLKHSRTQELEADDMGLELMARAGYNPNEAVTLWKKMAAQGGGKPPEILSTHPADSTRISNLEGLIPKVMPFYKR
jgi:predicted Zn-dependent protease